MSFSFTVNQSPATGGVAMFALVAKMLAQGWLKKADSDGSTYSSTGAQVTGGGTGANGLGNVNAWVRVQRPDTGAEYTIQRGSSNTVWRIKYVEAATFVGGTPGATQTPSATGEGVALGGGTDASPTFGTVFDNDTTYRMQLGVDGASPYGFWMVCYPSLGAVAHTAFIYEPLSDTATGDPSPYAIYVFNGTDAFSVTNMGTTNASIGMRGYVGAIATANFMQMECFSINSNSGSNLYPYGAGVNPITGNDDGCPVPVGRTIAQDITLHCDKGRTTLMRWCGVQRANSGDLGTLSVAKDRIIFTGVHLPWDTVTTPT